MSSRTADGSVALSRPVYSTRAFHLELDQPVQLDRVLHRQLLHDRLHEAVDDHLRGASSSMPRLMQVEELVLAELETVGLVLDVHVSSSISIVG
jgi:hypothetical protein